MNDFKELMEEAKDIQLYLKVQKVQLGDLKVGRFVGGYYDRKRII